MLTPNELVEHIEFGKCWLADLTNAFQKAQVNCASAQANLALFIREYYIIQYCETNNKAFVSEEGVYYFYHYGYVQNVLQRLATMRSEDIPEVITKALKTLVVCHPFQTPIGSLVPSYCPEHLKHVPHKNEY